MAITDQLKSLYVKLGGDPSVGASNIEEWIGKIEDVAGSGAEFDEEMLEEIMPLYVEITRDQDQDMFILNIEAMKLARALNFGRIVIGTWRGGQYGFGGLITSFRAEPPEDGVSAYYRYKFYTDIKPFDDYTGPDGDKMTFIAMGDTFNISDYPYEVTAVG